MCSYLGSKAITESSYLWYYTEYGSTSSIIDLIQLGSYPNGASVILSDQANYLIYGLEVLLMGTSSNLFVMITQDFSSTSDVAYVVAVTTYINL